MNFAILDGIKGNFYVTEEEYVAPSSFHEEREFSEWMIYSNFKEIVEHQQYVFVTREQPGKIRI